MKYLALFLLAFFLSLAGTRAESNVITVGPAGDHSSISEAIAVAQTGDVIQVDEGTYNEALLINGLNISIQGAGKGLSIIDGSGLAAEHLIHITNIDGEFSLKGFTIQNAPGTTRYPLYVSACNQSASLSITNNEFVGNNAAGNDWGLYAYASTGQFTINNNTFNNIGRDALVLERVTGPVEVAHNHFLVRDYTAGASAISSFSYGSSAEPWQVTGKHHYHNNLIESKGATFTFGIYDAIKVTSAAGFGSGTGKYGSFDDVLIENNEIKDITPFFFNGKAISILANHESGDVKTRIVGNVISTLYAVPNVDNVSRGIRILGNVSEAEILYNKTNNLTVAVAVQGANQNDTDSPYEDIGDTYFPINVFVNYNELLGTDFAKPILNSSEDIVDAACNWYGTDDPAIVAGFVSTNVKWFPFLQSPLGPCGGFAPVTNLTKNLFYLDIQSAIDDAAPGDVLEVTSGTYNENITLDKEGLTLRSASGNPEDVLIDAQGSGTAVTITADEVRLKGFTIQNAEMGEHAGIGIAGASGCVIENNIVQNNMFGIAVLATDKDASHNTIVNNTIQDNGIIDWVADNGSTKLGEGNGIRIGSLDSSLPGVATNNLIENNQISGSRNGIQLGSSASETFIGGNHIFNNWYVGLHLVRSNDNTIDGNFIHDNGVIGLLPDENGYYDSQEARNAVGIRISGASGNLFIHNEVHNEAGTGGLQQKGFRLFDGGGIAPDGNIINENQIYGHAEGDSPFLHGIDNRGYDTETPIPVNALRNWWGHESGPFHETNPDGQGNSVSDNVLFDPWWTNEEKSLLEPVAWMIPAFSDEEYQFTATGLRLQFDGTSNIEDQTVTVTLSYDSTAEVMPSVSTINTEGAATFLSVESRVANEGPTGTYRLTLDVSDFPGINDPSRLHLFKREDALSQWVNIGTPLEESLEDFPVLSWESPLLDKFSDFSLANADMVDVAINRTGCESFEVVLRPNFDITPWPQPSNVQFTVKWPEVDGLVLDFESVSPPWEFTADGPNLYDGNQYVTLATEFPDPAVQWDAMSENPVVRFSHNQAGEGTASFTIMDNDDPYVEHAAGMNPPRSSVYYFEMAGSEMTGVRYTGSPSAEDVPLGKCLLSIGGSFETENKAYDGNAIATISDGSQLTLVGLVGDDDGKVSLTDIEARFANKDVGSWPVSIIMAGLDGDKAGMYSLSLDDAPTSSALIEARTLSITVDGNPTKDYDGNASATLVPDDYGIAGLVGNEIIGVTQTSGLYASANAGTRLVTVNLVNPDDFVQQSGALLFNYALPGVVSGDGTILPLALTISAEDKEKVYDGEVFSPFTVTYGNDFLPGEGIGDLLGTLTFTGTAVSATAVGVYEDEIIPAGYDETINYDITFVPGTLEIKPVTVSLKAFLQGPYEDGSMITRLADAGQVPTLQPYNQAPWHYAGNESADPMPENVVDWVLLEFRTDDKTTLPAGRAAGLLYTDGSVDVEIDHDVWDELKAGEDYYVVIWHRNHLPLMSNEALGVPVASNDRVDLTQGNHLLAGSFRDIEGTAALAAGDVTRSGQLGYSGPGNDRGPIIARLFNDYDAPNFNHVVDPLNAYLFEDVLVNNRLSYVEPPNDRGIIIANIEALSGSPFLTARYDSPVPGAFNPANKQHYNEGPVHITASGREISIMSDEAIMDGLVDNIQFTLAWRSDDALAGEAVGNMQIEAFHLQAQGGVTVVDGVSYQVMASTFPSPLPNDWASGEGIPVIAFPGDIGGRIWIAEDEFCAGNNALYYLSIWGQDHTGKVRTYDETTAVSPVDAEDHLRLYPNPTSTGTIYVELPASIGQQADIAIYDIRGMLIKELKGVDAAATTSIGIPGLSNGIYYLQASSGVQRLTKKFVIAQ